MSHRPDRGSHYPAGASGSAENVAMRSGDAPGVDIGAMIFEQWLHSPRHYENMVNRDLNALGIGLAYNSATNSWYATQNFATYQDPAGAGLVES